LNFQTNLNHTPRGWVRFYFVEKKADLWFPLRLAMFGAHEAMSLDERDTLLARDAYFFGARWQGVFHVTLLSHCTGQKAVPLVGCLRTPNGDTNRFLAV